MGRLLEDNPGGTGRRWPTGRHTGSVGAAPLWPDEVCAGAAAVEDSVIPTQTAVAVSIGAEHARPVLSVGLRTRRPAVD